MDLIVVGVRSVDFDLERCEFLGENGFDKLNDVFRLVDFMLMASQSMKKWPITHLDFACVDNRRVPRCGIGACKMEGYELVEG